MDNAGADRLTARMFETINGIDAIAVIDAETICSRSAVIRIAKGA